MKYFLFENTVIAVIVVSLTIFFAILGIDLASMEQEISTGTIVDKHYKAERTSTGSGVAVGSNGKVAPVVITEHEDEDFLLMIERDSIIATINCEPEFYYKKEIGDVVKFASYRGGVFGGVWSKKIIE